jgi:hypothetical protein
MPEYEHMCEKCTIGQYSGILPGNSTEELYSRLVPGTFSVSNTCGLYVL